LAGKSGFGVAKAIEYKQQLVKAHLVDCATVRLAIRWQFLSAFSQKAATPVR
jgi:hypothetical protein